jgi:hypothetical protein
VLIYFHERVYDLVCEIIHEYIPLRNPKKEKEK